MPPRTRIESKDVLSTLKKYKHFFQSGEVPKYSHAVWKDLEKEHNRLWTHHNWYSKLKQDKNRLWSLFMEELKIDLNKNETLNNTLEVSQEENNNTLCFIDRSDEESEVWFDCYLQQEVWTQFGTILMSNLNDIMQYVISGDLLDKLVEPAFWKQNRLPCVFGFDGAKVDTSSDIFLKMRGFCKSDSCKNEFYGCCHVKPRSNNDDLHIRVRTIDTRNTKHENMRAELDNLRKRQCAKEVIEMNRGEKTLKRRKRIPKSTSSQDSANTRNESLYHDRKVYEQDPIKRISKMQFDRHFFGSIHDVSYSPVYIHYGLPVQGEIYKTYTRTTRNSTIYLGRMTNCCEKLVRPKELPSAEIAMYAIAIKFDDTVFPVYQLLTEDAESATLEFWIKRWLRRVIAKPKHVICPYSRSMLSACVHGFNNVTIERYIAKIYLILMAGSGLPRDLTIIRIDFFDLAQIVLAWPCLRSVDSSDVRLFYVQSIASLATSHTIDEFKQLFTLICAVAFQNYDDSILQVEFASSTHDARRKLQDTFSIRNPYITDYWKSIDEGKIFEESSSNTEIDDCSRDSFCGSFISKLRMGNDILGIDIVHNSASPVIEIFIQDLITSALLTRQRGTQLNPYFLPAMMIGLFQLGKEFPMWSAVALPAVYLSQSKNHGQVYVERSVKKLVEFHNHSSEVDVFLESHLHELSKNISNAPLSTLSSVSTKHRSTSHSLVPPGGASHGPGMEKIPMQSPVKNELSTPHKPVMSRGYSHDLGVQEIPIKSPVMKVSSTSHSLVVSGGSSLDSVIQKNPIQSPLIQEILDSWDCDLAPSPKVSKEAFQSCTEDAASFDPSLLRNNVQETMKKTKLYDVVYGKISQSKFFKNVPEIQVVNRLESRTLKLFFLQNGNLSPPVTVHGKKFKVMNTCALDSITRVLVVNAVDDPNYRSFIKKSDDQMMRFINLFLNNASQTLIWQERIRILAPHYQIHEIETNYRTILFQFDAFDNLACVWKNSTSEPSAITVLECKNCGDQVNACSILSPNHWTIIRNGFKSLESALQFQSLLFNVLCQKCKVETILKKATNYHLFIELDIRTGKNNQTTKQCRLEEFPEEISVDLKEIASEGKVNVTTEKYRLAGVIDLLGHHYTAYCRRLSGVWEHYNDLKSKVSVAGKEKMITPHGAIYILKTIANND